MLKRKLIALLPIAVVCWMFAGCEPAPKAKPAAKPAEKKDDHGHDHSHSHASKGPHGGHISEVGKEEYHLEWSHDDASGKVTVYVLDGDMKKEVPIGAEKLTVATKSGDEAKEYELAAVDRKEEKSAKFEVADKALIGVLETLSKEVTATVKEIEIDGKKFSDVNLTLEHDHH